MIDGVLNEVQLSLNAACQLVQPVFLALPGALRVILARAWDGAHVASHCDSMWLHLSSLLTMHSKQNSLHFGEFVFSLKQSTVLAVSAVFCNYFPLPKKKE